MIKRDHENTARMTVGGEAASNSTDVRGEHAATHGPLVAHVSMTVNGQVRAMTVEPRTTLLDALRDALGLTGTKKACDRGECGACMQAAFIEHDGFQCGFCTSGQIMSAVAMIEEAKAGWPSAATADVRSPFIVADLSDAEIRERMSGNLCRCACYPNIVDAVAEAAAGS